MCHFKGRWLFVLRDVSHIGNKIELIDDATIGISVNCTTAVFSSVHLKQLRKKYLRVMPLDQMHPRYQAWLTVGGEPAMKT